MTTTLDPDRLAEVMAPDFLLDRDSHKPGGRMCELEAVAYVAVEPWTASPRCASPVLAAFLRVWNDHLDDDTRQTLKQYIPRLVGSTGTQAQEAERSWMAFDWLVRTYTPAWLRRAGLDDQADRLAGLAELRARTDVSSVDRVIDAACTEAKAARATARAAAGVAAWDAAEGAAGYAAWATAVLAAAAQALAALTAAQNAARAAAWDVGGATARAALQPTVVELQASAHRLVDRMLAVTETVA